MKNKEMNELEIGGEKLGNYFGWYFDGILGKFVELLRPPGIGQKCGFFSKNHAPVRFNAVKRETFENTYFPNFDRGHMVQYE